MEGFISGMKVFSVIIGSTIILGLLALGIQSLYDKIFGGGMLVEEKRYRELYGVRLDCLDCKHCKKIYLSSFSL